MPSPTSSPAEAIAADARTEGATASAADAGARGAAASAAVDPERLLHERFRIAAATPWLTLYEQDTDLRYTWLYPPHAEHAHALGHTDEELSVDGSYDTLAAAKRRVMRTRVPVRIEVQVPGAGHGRWYDVYICPRLNGAGEVVGVTGAATDISDRKRTESALRQNEDRLRATYRNAPIGIAESDLNGVLISVNDRYSGQLGYAPAEMLGRSFVEFTHPDDRAESLREFQALVDGTGGDTPRQRRYLHKEGRIVWVAVTRSLIRDSQGHARFAFAIAEDITEQRNAAAQRELLYHLVATVNRAANVQEVFEAALDALCESYRCRRGSILLFDDAGVMRFVAARGLSAEYRAAVEGHSPWRKDDPDPQPVCVPNVARHPLPDELRVVIEREGIAALAFIPITYERRLLGKFMVYFDEPYEFTAARLQMAETIARQVSVAIARFRAADELEALVRTRTASLHDAIQQMEEFSYTVSHDLRAPVRGMMTYANAILEDHGAALGGEVKEFLNRILKNARRMDALVRDTLAYSRVARGDLVLAPLSLDEVVLVARAECGNPAAIRVESPLGAAIGHESSLVQVFANLFTNAVKFVHAGTAPNVVVRAERSADRVRVTVQDNGIGIPPDLHARAFNIFERLHAAASYEGTGIGLAIVRKAVERMGGRVGLVSDGVQGSTFWVELPSPRVDAAAR